uniref:Nucleoprotein n=1 Tax=Varroa orthomyxovirus-1 TaxID=2510845 RepID=A0A8K1QXL9_9ORTO|nr:MAG: nucleoprotein [Varroa orthomyxovirus-1]
MNESMEVAVGTSSNRDELVTRFEANPNDIRDKYKEYQRLMLAMASTADINITIDRNAELIGSAVMAGLTENKSVEREFEAAFVVVNSAGVITLVDKKISMDVVNSARNVKLNTHQGRASWYPFLAALQLSAKTKDQILWQKSKVTTDLGVPTVCEPYAGGWHIKDKFKRSRALSIGPITHLWMYKKFQDRQDGSRKKRLAKEALRGIKERIRKTLKRQSIGVTQKKIIDAIFDEDKWELAKTLCLSYLGIKPHIEHHFVMTYPLIAVISDWEGANFSNEWVWITLCNNIQKISFAAPDNTWPEFLMQCNIHGVLQSQAEDLGLLEDIFGMRFYQRKDFGRFDNKKVTLVSKPANPLAYKYWVRPQKGAPRVIEGARRGQISSKPSLKCARRSYNQFTSLDELEKAYVSVSSENFVEEINKEFSAYTALQLEGSTYAFKKGSNPREQWPGQVATNGKYLFGN